MKPILTILIMIVSLSFLFAQSGGKEKPRAAIAPPEANEITCGRIIYGKGKSSICFADNFLVEVRKQTKIKAHPRFIPVKLGTDEVFETPLSVISGEGNFKFTDEERKNLKKYLTNGGFLFASPGCSDKNWAKAFAQELAAMFPDNPLKALPMDHKIFSTVKKIPVLTVGSKTVLLEGIEIDGRLALVYSSHGLNNARKAKGCCCCGGSEIKQSVDVNLNVVTYALLY